MKIALLTGPRQVEIAEAPEPAIERDGDVLLRVERVGICGSDVHYYLEGRIGNQIVQYPATVGHECAGTVVEVGRGVKSFRKGDRVAVDPASNCGTCDQCRAGRGHTCRRLQFMGCPGQSPGAAAELCVVPAACCFPVPESMSFDEATAAEPLSIGLHAVRLSGLAEGARIGVLGAGPIGLSVLLCAKALGRCTAYVTDLLDERLAVARRCGADGTARFERHQDSIVGWVERSEPHLEERPQLQSHELDVVFECSGDPAAIDQAQRLLTPGGTLMLVGIPPVDWVGFDPHFMRRAELVYRAVRRQNDCMAAAIELVACGKVDLRPLVTHHFPLEQIREAFELVAGYRDGVIKAMLHLPHLI